MFIKVSKNAVGQAYYYLMESYRDHGKVKQRMLLSLGRVEDNRLDDLIAAISKHKEVFTLVNLAKEISADQTFVLGPLLILQRIFMQSGIDAILSDINHKHPKLGFNMRELVFTMIAARFVRPGSKLKIYEHWQKKLYPGLVIQNIALHHLYRALNVLAEHKDEIEKGLYWHERDLLNQQVDIVLYDLTTLRFESTRTDLGELRQFGYSKERRSDCTQVVLGLLVTPDGLPLGFEVYPGNTFEGNTIADIITKLRGKYRVRRFIFVGDRGLFSQKNLTELRDANSRGEFIVGMKLGVFKKRYAEFYDISRYKWINNDLAVYETQHKGDRCIITWSRVRAERDHRAREDVLEKIRKKLAKKKITAKQFVTNKTYQRYVVGLNNNQDFKLNEKAIAEDARRDGYFGVVTNVKDQGAETIVANYKTLWIVEDSFGEIKGTLRARPVFHWKDERIIGHLVLCFLAYLCEARLTVALRRKNLLLTSPAIDNEIIEERPLTVMEAMRELQEVRAIPVRVRTTTVWVRTDISGNAQKLFSAIGLKLPPKVLRTIKDENVVTQNATKPLLP